MTSSNGRSEASASAQKRFAYHRYAADIARGRRIAWLAASLWVGIGILLHVTLFPTLGRGSAALALAVFLAPTPIHAAFLYVISRDPLPPERLVVVLGGVNFVLSGVALAFVASRTGGITSPYHFVILLSLFVQVFALPRPWLDNLIVGILTIAICPIGVLIISRYDDAVRAQLHRPEDVTRFYGLLVILATAVAVTTFSGHVHWALQQSAYESKSIGRYRLLRRIGKGGMGEVWRANDKVLRRDVALKILSPEHGRSPAAIARFEREIEATAALEHPNSVRVHDWGVTYDGVWYYAMELLDGYDLTSLVERRGRLPAAQVARLGAQAARAVGEAHRRGIVHRDLKPSNLFAVAIDGVIDHVKVLDFGIARLDASESGSSDMTQTGAVIGTPGYIAPEVMGGAAATPRSDVWGLGATLFFALTGTKLRDADDSSPAALVADVPRALDGVLLRALDPDPACRPTSAGDFADELDATGLAAACQPLHMDPPPPTDHAIGEQDTLAEGPAARDRRASS